MTAVTVAAEFRTLGIAKTLMGYLEEVSEKNYNGFFVDLFVRESNEVAIKMYRRLGYSIYRRVLGYYSGEEDAYGKKKLIFFIGKLTVLQSLFRSDMRKALPRDVTKSSVIPLDHPITPEELEW